VCPVAEKIFGDFSELSLNKRLEAIAEEKRKKYLQNPFLQKNISRVHIKNYYGSLPFEKI
jgi:hypothetical protein